jgi:hypothetical protein
MVLARCRLGRVCRCAGRGRGRSLRERTQDLSWSGRWPARAQEVSEVVGEAGPTSLSRSNRPRSHSSDVMLGLCQSRLTSFHICSAPPTIKSRRGREKFLLLRAWTAHLLDSTSLVAWTLGARRRSCSMFTLIVTIYIQMLYNLDHLSDCCTFQINTLVSHNSFISASQSIDFPSNQQSNFPVRLAC